MLCILLFVQVEADYGPLLCVVHNIGANIGHVPIADTSTRVYTKVSKYNARESNLWDLMPINVKACTTFRNQK